jgi:hypothetical protein
MHLRGGFVPGVSRELYEAQTGLNADDGADIRRFLNRLLSMDVGAQHAVFDYFSTLLDGQIEEAIDNGTLNVGLETLKGDEFHAVSEQQIATHEETGAQTHHLQLSIKTRNTPTPWGDIAYFLRPDNAGGYTFERWVTNKRSGNLFAVVESYPRENPKTGAMVPMVRLMSPSDSRRVPAADVSDRLFDTLPPPPGGWSNQTFATPGAQALWEQAVASAPEFRTRT